MWKLKGITCAYVKPQRCYTPKEDASSTTISLEYLFTSIIIDTQKGIDVEFFDAPGAYLNADTPEDKLIILKIEGEFGEIMFKVNP